MVGETVDLRRIDAQAGVVCEVTGKAEAGFRMTAELADQRSLARIEFGLGRRGGGQSADFVQHQPRDFWRRDEDGYYWITGRVDDVINVSGHRLGTAEIESALVAHPAVAEAAVVGFPHDIKGQAIYAYVTLKADQTPSEPLRAELVKWVRQEIGGFAAPEAIQWAPGLPKTRSGKIMRRILRKVAEGDVSNLGDTTTLADPAVVDDLVANRVGG
jgi:hypothetical protein